MDHIRLTVRPTFLGNVMILEDIRNSNAVEIMEAQYQGAIHSQQVDGELPHGGYDIDHPTMYIYHDDAPDNGVTVNIPTLNAWLVNGNYEQGTPIGVKDI